MIPQASVEKEEEEKQAKQMFFSSVFVCWLKLWSPPLFFETRVPKREETAKAQPGTLCE